MYAGIRVTIGRISALWPHRYRRPVTCCGPSFPWPSAPPLVFVPPLLTSSPFSALHCAEQSDILLCLSMPDFNVENRADEHHLAFTSKGKDKSIAIPTEQSQVLRSNELNEDGWASELQGNIHVFNGDMQEYMDIFVPSRTPMPMRAAPPQNVFANVPVNVPESQMYMPLVSIECRIHVYHSHNQVFV